METPPRYRVVADDGGGVGRASRGRLFIARRGVGAEPRALSPTCLYMSIVCNFFSSAISPAGGSVSTYRVAQIRLRIYLSGYNNKMRPLKINNITNLNICKGIVTMLYLILWTCSVLLYS